MHRKLLLLLIPCLVSSFANANDSSSQVVENLTQSQTFSSANKNGTLIFNGGTSGRIGIPSGYKEVSVNGFTHHIGYGYVTRVPVMPAQYVDAVSCGRGCNITRYTATIPECTIIITDTYAQGCSVDVRVLTSASCRTSSNDNDYCYGGSTATYKYNGIIYSAFGSK
ncbi:hypothetical protein L1D14_10495 [Vibrio tubiashii]|uniref:hypothetical protein n=1 Tax=Vibrio tubiashii TaxID=29498 RepID=UPI001EFC9E62|nr:hypothetical protein [Vibrio tubiashii]MCG9576666.1 hypothetical protein [Vibrio tubiashii]